MAIEIEYDGSIDCMVIVATGVLDYSGFPELAKGLLEHSKFRKNIHQLFDCRNGELFLTTDDLKNIANDFSAVADVLGLERKLALVVTRDADFGRLRQYEVFFQSGPGVKTHVFRSLDEARNWLIE